MVEAIDELLKKHPNCYPCDERGYPIQSERGLPSDDSFFKTYAGDLIKKGMKVMRNGAGDELSAKVYPAPGPNQVTYMKYGENFWVFEGDIEFSFLGFKEVTLA